MRLGAADMVPAAELVEAEYAVVRDAEDRIELRATPAGVEYMKMIDALTRPATGLDGLGDRHG